MEGTDLKKKATRGALWSTIDKFSYLGINFIVNLILVRLLLPSDFGAIGMLAIFIAVSQTITDGGFSSALIQKKNLTSQDYSTVFFWNLIFSIIIYLILFFSAPFIASFYKMPVLKNVLRVIGISIIITGINSIQIVRLKRELAFKSIAINRLICNTTASVISIALAFLGFGIWSLVCLQVLNGIISVILLRFITRWTPKIFFSFKILKEFFSFGGYMLAANLLQEICNNLQGLIIGKKFSAAQMGYFSQAYKLDTVSCNAIPQILVQVMFPLYSSMQDNKPKLIELLRNNVRLISFIVFPIISMLILVANELITFLYGSVWSQAAPYYQILCFGGFFLCLQNINFYAVAAVGKSRSLFFWSFYKWGFLLTCLLIGMLFGIYGILWGMVLSNINIYIVNSLLVERFIGFSFFNQLKSIFPTILFIIVSFGVSFIPMLLNLSSIFLVLFFIASYLTLSALFNPTMLKETFSLAKLIIKK